jgi:hypothetical protein
MEEEAQQDDVVQQEVEQQVAIHVAQLNVDVAQRDDDDDAQWDVSGSGASGSRNVCLQGPTILPQRPILSDMRPLNRTDGEKYATLVVVAAFSYYIFKFIIESNTFSLSFG